MSPNGPPDPRTPVLVGVGTAEHDAGPVELMASALQAAATDAGRRDALLARLGQLSVPQGTWSFEDPARLVARAVGAPRARTELIQLGVPQQTPINQTLADIWAGRLEVGAVVGGEAMRWARRHRPAPAPGEGGPPDQLVSPRSEIVSAEERAAGLVAPVTQYAMIDNALRAAEGIDLAEHRRRIDALWSRFNAVAADNPKAAFPTPRSPEALASPSGGNRALAFPYRKWHASQWTVDQAAALLFCSLETARELSLDKDRLVFPLLGLEADHAVVLSRRRALARWPAMGVLGEVARRHLATPLDDIEVTELYSCFPAAVRVQQRELGLPVDGTPTITGGMPFAGGPLNNFVYQATAAVIERLRAAPGSLGLVTTVSGLLTKPGLAAWSTEPLLAPLLGELGREARSATTEAEVVPAHDGSATVVTYTVTFVPAPEAGADSTPERLVALLDLPDGRRSLAETNDPALMAQAQCEELIGRPVEVRGTRLLGTR